MRLVPGSYHNLTGRSIGVFLGGILTKVFIFSTLCCYSRYRKYFVSLDAKLGSVIEALEDAFIFLGGGNREAAGGGCQGHGIKKDGCYRYLEYQIPGIC